MNIIADLVIFTWIEIFHATNLSIGIEWVQLQGRGMNSWNWWKNYLTSSTYSCRYSGNRRPKEGEVESYRPPWNGDVVWSVDQVYGALSFQER